MLTELLMNKASDRLAGFSTQYYRFQGFRFSQPEYDKQLVP